MIKDYKPSEWKSWKFYELVFDDGKNNGFGFPCDENGDLNLTEEQRKNYEFAMNHPEKFERYNEVVMFTGEYKEDASGICECGERIELFDEYMGACECPYCGLWYNMFGQELKHPDEWIYD